MAERIVGIDFGTSTSVIRVRRYEHGVPIDMIPNAVTFNNAAPMVPTLIQKQEDVKSAYYGYDAETPKKKATVYQNFKLDLESPNPVVREKAKELTAEYLKECLGKAYQHQSENGFFGDSSDVVTTYISYPVKWNEETRAFMIQATKDAGFPNVKGLDEAQACIRAVTEQNAAMLTAKGYFKANMRCTILLIDMGAGTTDLVLCRHTPGAEGNTAVLNSWPKKGEALFGGHTIDDILYTYITESFPDVQAVKRLPLSTFKAWKENIVSPALLKGETVDYFTALEPIEMALGKDLTFDPIDHEKFEELTGNYLKILPKMINGILTDAHVQGKDIDLILLTGGHSQWYFVREMLLGRMPKFGKVLLDKIQAEPERIVSLARPQETVALGLVYNPPTVKPTPDEMQFVPASDPDCTRDGNIAFWIRKSDKACFRDENATIPIAFPDTQLQTSGHNFECKYVDGKRILVCTRCGANGGEEPVETNEGDDEPTPEEEFQLGHSEIGNDYSIVKYLGERSRVIIPETIRGRKVVQIGESAFAASTPLFPNRTLTYVEIPRTVSKINDRAFFYCKNLKQVKAHDGILSIGDEAFMGCENLEHFDFGGISASPSKVIYFPKKMRVIGKNAFSCGINNLFCYLNEVTLSKKTTAKNTLLILPPFPGCLVFYYEDNADLQGNSDE